MDRLHKILTGIIIVVALGCVYLGYHWLQAHDAQIRAEAADKATKAALDAIAAHEKDLQDQLAQIKKEQADKIDSINRNFTAAQNPQQFAALLAGIMGLKQVPVVVQSSPTPTNPNPQSVIELPDTPQAKQYFQDCELCKANLQAALKQAAISDQKLEAANDKIDLITKSRDEWKDTAKGGSWIKRAGKTGEHLLIGGGIALAILCGSGHCNNK